MTSSCVECNEELTLFTEVLTQTGRSVPRPGDRTICPVCGTMMEFKPDMTLKEVPYDCRIRA